MIVDRDSKMPYERILLFIFARWRHMVDGRRQTMRRYARRKQSASSRAVLRFMVANIAASIDNFFEPKMSDIPHALNIIVRASGWSIILYNYVGINHRV